MAISPWTDLTCSSDSYKTKNKVSPAPLDSWTVFSKYYVGANEATHPLISPLFGDLKGLPPLLINSAVDDVSFRPGENMVHCYPLLAPMFKEASLAMNEIVVLIKKQLNV